MPPVPRKRPKKSSPIQDANTRGRGAVLPIATTPEQAVQNRVKHLAPHERARAAAALRPRVTTVGNQQTIRDAYGQIASQGQGVVVPGHTPRQTVPLRGVTAPGAPSIRPATQPFIQRTYGIAPAPTLHPALGGGATPNSIAQQIKSRYETRTPSPGAIRSGINDPITTDAEEDTFMAGQKVPRKRGASKDYERGVVNLTEKVKLNRFRQLMEAGADLSPDDQAFADAYQAYKDIQAKSPQSRKGGRSDIYSSRNSGLSVSDQAFWRMVDRAVNKANSQGYTGGDNEDVKDAQKLDTWQAAGIRRLTARIQANPEQAAALAGQMGQYLTPGLTQGDPAPTTKAALTELSQFGTKSGATRNVPLPEQAGRGDRVKVGKTNAEALAKGTENQEVVEAGIGALAASLADPAYEKLTDYSDPLDPQLRKLMDDITEKDEQFGLAYEHLNFLDDEQEKQLRDLSRLKGREDEYNEAKTDIARLRVAKGAPPADFATRYARDIAATATGIPAGVVATAGAIGALAQGNEKPIGEIAQAQIDFISNPSEWSEHPFQATMMFVPVAGAVSKVAGAGIRAAGKGGMMGKARTLPQADVIHLTSGKMLEQNMRFEGLGGQGKGAKVNTKPDTNVFAIRHVERDGVIKPVARLIKPGDTVHAGESVHAPNKAIAARRESPAGVYKKGAFAYGHQRLTDKLAGKVNSNLGKNVTGLLTSSKYAKFFGPTKRMHAFQLADVQRHIQERILAITGPGRRVSNDELGILMNSRGESPLMWADYFEKNAQRIVAVDPKNITDADVARLEHVRNTDSSQLVGDDVRAKELLKTSDEFRVNGERLAKRDPDKVAAIQDVIRGQQDDMDSIMGKLGLELGDAIDRRYNMVIEAKAELGDPAMIALKKARENKNKLEGRIEKLETNMPEAKRRTQGINEQDKKLLKSQYELGTLSPIAAQRASGGTLTTRIKQARARIREIEPQITALERNVKSESIDADTAVVEVRTNISEIQAARQDLTTMLSEVKAQLAGETPETPAPVVTPTPAPKASKKKGRKASQADKDALAAARDRQAKFDAVTGDALKGPLGKLRVTNLQRAQEALKKKVGDGAYDKIDEIGLENITDAQFEQILANPPDAPVVAPKAAPKTPAKDVTPKTNTELKAAQSEINKALARARTMEADLKKQERSTKLEATTRVQDTPELADLRSQLADLRGVVDESIESRKAVRLAGDKTPMSAGSTTGRKATGTEQGVALWEATAKERARLARHNGMTTHEFMDWILEDMKEQLIKQNEDYGARVLAMRQEYDSNINEPGGAMTMAEPWYSPEVNIKDNVSEHINAGRAIAGNLNVSPRALQSRMTPSSGVIFREGRAELSPVVWMSESLRPLTFAAQRRFADDVIKHNSIAITPGITWRGDQYDLLDTHAIGESVRTGFETGKLRPGEDSPIDHAFVTNMKDVPNGMKALSDDKEILANAAADPRRYQLVPKSLAQGMKNEFGKTSDISGPLRYMDWALKRWRFGVLYLNPRWLVNNLVGNVSMAMLSNPRSLLSNQKLMHETGDLKGRETYFPTQTEFRGTAGDIHGGDYTTGSQAQRAFDAEQSSAQSSWYDLLDRVRNNEYHPSDVINGPINGIKALGHAARDANTGLENNLRRRVWLSSALPEARKRAISNMVDAPWFKRFTDKFYLMNDAVMAELENMARKAEKQDISDPEAIAALDKVNDFMGEYLLYGSHPALRQLFPFQSWVRFISTFYLYKLPKQYPGRGLFLNRLGALGEQYYSELEDRTQTAQGGLDLSATDDLLLMTGGLNPIATVAGLARTKSRSGSMILDPSPLAGQANPVLQTGIEMLTGSSGGFSLRNQEGATPLYDPFELEGWDAGDWTKYLGAKGLSLLPWTNTLTGAQPYDTYIPGGEYVNPPRSKLAQADRTPGQKILGNLGIQLRPYDPKREQLAEAKRLNRQDQIRLERATEQYGAATLDNPNFDKIAKRMGFSPERLRESLGK